MGYGIEEQLPAVVFVAHYDAFGVAPVIHFLYLFDICNTLKSYHF